MDVSPLAAPGRQLIQAYGGGGFVISGTRHQGSVLVFPLRTVSWAVAADPDVDALPLAALVDAAAEIDLVLLGLGRDVRFVPPRLRATLKAAGIAVEPMTTAAACRTYNVLLGENRRVAAALVAID